MPRSGDSGEVVTIRHRLNGRRARLHAWFDMLVTDHGVVRLVHPNWGEVAPGVYRSSQPSPGQLRRAHAKGIRTVLNLRAERDCGAFVLQEAACAELGMDLVNVQVRSRDVPSKALIGDLDRLFATLPRPLLMHCKSGADRTGIVGALYLILHEGRPVEEAVRSQLSWRWGHVRHAKTGMLDFFFESYLAANRARPMPFRQWVEEVYDPVAVKAAFKAKFKPWLGVDVTFWRE
ncbi:MAG: fused DSP-PTPase phosphatase/NAD kinase-like protein [Pseudomonadota bacterium]